MKTIRVLCLCGVALVLLGAPARCATLYFRVTGTNDLLGNSGNWYFSDGMGGYVGAGRLPNGTDNAVVLDGGDGGAGVFQVSTLTLEGVGVMNGNYTAQTIAVTDGSGFIGSTITIPNGGQIQFSGTNFGCSLNATTVTIQPGGSFSVTTSNSLTLLGGTLVYDEGVVLLADGSIVNGVPGTNTLDILPGAQLMSNGKAIVEAVGSPGPFTINNNGTVVCNSGFLEFIGTTIISTNGLARFQTPSPTAVMFLNPPDIGAGVTFLLTGPGTNRLSGGTIDGTLQVGAIDPQTGLFTPGNLDLNSGAQIQGTGQIHVVSSNSLASTLAATNAIFTFTTINTDPGVPFSIANSAQFISNIVNNAGTILWSNISGDQITFSGASIFNNLAGGTFIELDNAASLAQVAQQLQSVFNNYGTFRIEGGSNTISLGTFTMLFNNSGLLDVEAGTANLNNGTNSGQFNVAGGTTLAFVGPTNTINPGATFTGPGLFQINGTLFVNGSVIIPNMNMVSSSPVIDGPGRLTVGNNCVWTLGTIQGSGTFNVAPAATMTINGGVTLYQRTLNNSGAIIWSANDNLISGNGAVINNLAGGLFNIATSATLRGFNVLPIATFNNYGTVEKTSGTANSFFLYVNNAGIFEVLTQGMNLQYLFQQTGGSTIFSPGTTITEPGGFDILGGTFIGAGSFNGPLTNSGAVHPGISTGVLTLTSGGNNNYTQAVNGTLIIELGGLTAGTQYSQVAAPGVPVALGGSLNVQLVNGFVPVAGEQFTILTCGSRTGTFAILNGTYLGNGLALVPVYTSTNVTLVASNVTVLQPPISVALTGAQGNSLQLTWPTVIGQQYQVQYSADLSQWFVLSNFTASATSSSVIDPAPIAGVPKRFYRVR